MGCNKGRSPTKYLLLTVLLQKRRCEIVRGRLPIAHLDIIG